MCIWLQALTLKLVYGLLVRIYLWDLLDATGGFIDEHVFQPHVF